MKIRIALLLFFVNVLLVIHHSHSLIQMEYQNNINPSLVSTHFGYPSQQLYLPVDIKAQFTWVTPRRYEYRESLTGKILSDFIEIKINDDRFYGNEYEDVIHLGDDIAFSVPNFNLLLVSEFSNGDGHVKSALGFAFRFQDEKYSLIHQLKKQGQINSLSFSFVRDLSKRDGYFFVGGVPPEIEKTPSTSCKVHGMNNYWDCVMNKVKIGEHEYINYDYSYFDTSLKMIYAPPRFMEFFNTIFLEDALKNDQCQIKKYTWTVKYGCSSEYLTKFPKITFYLDDKPYVLSGKSMFNCDWDICDLYIIENKRSNDWIFGTLFLENYHLLFDYENQQIHFYENTKTFTEIVNSRKSFPFVFVNILIVSVGIGILVLAKKKFKMF